MPELDAFHSFSLLINSHFPTYFFSDKTRKKDLIGAYAGSYLSWDILKICDREVFNHLKALPAHTYFFPLVASFQAISQPFTELQRLWDFLFCFGVHLNPVLAAAQIIINKKHIMSQNPARLLQGLLSQRKWMNQRLDAKAVIDCAMHLIILLKQTKHKKLWDNISKHSSNFDVAIQVKIEHENGVTYTQITTAHLANNGNNQQKTSQTNGHSNNGNTKPDEDDITEDDIGIIKESEGNNNNETEPKLKRFKTKSEENFGNINGRNSLRKIVEEQGTNLDDSSNDEDDRKDD